MLEVIDHFVVNKFDLIDRKATSMPNLCGESVAGKGIISISEPMDFTIVLGELTSVSQPMTTVR